jgi:hypothetical protein
MYKNKDISWFVYPSSEYVAKHFNDVVFKYVDTWSDDVTFDVDDDDYYSPCDWSYDDDE